MQIRRRGEARKSDAVLRVHRVADHRGSGMGVVSAVYYLFFSCSRLGVKSSLCAYGASLNAFRTRYALPRTACCAHDVADGNAHRLVDASGWASPSRERR